jgi:hypothetical protein
MCRCERDDALAQVEDCGVVDDLQRVRTCSGEHLECNIAADLVCSKLLTTRVGKMSTLSLDLRLIVQNDIQQ